MHVYKKNLNDNLAAGSPSERLLSHILQTNDFIEELRGPYFYTFHEILWKYVLYQRRYLLEDL